MTFKNTRVMASRLLTAARLFVHALRDDVANDVLPTLPRLRSVSRRDWPTEMCPTVFASYATDGNLRGSHRYCGGEKLLNNLVLLLRRRGYEAFMVSVDGEHSDWLCEHAPFVSVEEFRGMKGKGGAVRCVSSWVMARAFLDVAGPFYFWDQELAASSRSHFPTLARMMARGRIVKTAGVNRVVEAYHTAIFHRKACVLRQLVDEAYWMPDAARRVANRVGYFDEGDHGEAYVREIREITRAAGMDFEFVRLAGVEREIITQMQGCAVFLALNIGKSPLWGEGGPMTPQEAMACGTVPICFDMNGPWEFIQQGYNGWITAEIRPGLMAEALIAMSREPGRVEAMGRRAREIFLTSHSMEARWPAVARFLDLPLHG